MEMCGKRTHRQHSADVPPYCKVQYPDTASVNRQAGASRLALTISDLRWRPGSLLALNCLLSRAKEKLAQAQAAHHSSSPRQKMLTTLTALATTSLLHSHRGTHSHMSLDQNPSLDLESCSLKAWRRWPMLLLRWRWRWWWWCSTAAPAPSLASRPPPPSSCCRATRSAARARPPLRA
jgi:hypothetical protein